MPRPHSSKLALGALLALLLSPTLRAQTAKLPRKAAATSKLTPQQQTGLDILKSQIAAARALPPMTRAFALQQIARGYGNIAPARALPLLREALQATQVIDDSPANGSKHSLQIQILNQLMLLDPAYCESLIPQLSGAPRVAAISGLLKYHGAKKQFSKAIALLNQLGDEEFPYLAGSQLMQALPPEMAAERQNLFAQALASFSAHDHKNDFSLDDFGFL